MKIQEIIDKIETSTALTKKEIDCLSADKSISVERKGELLDVYIADWDETRGSVNRAQVKRRQLDDIKFIFIVTPEIDDFLEEKAAGGTAKAVVIREIIERSRTYKRFIQKRSNE